MCKFFKYRIKTFRYQAIEINSHFVQNHDQRSRNINIWAGELGDYLTMKLCPEPHIEI